MLVTELIEDLLSFIGEVILKLFEEMMLLRLFGDSLSSRFFPFS
jgi:hypothetical protein